MVTLGEGKYTYALSGTNWGNLPAGANYKEATSVAVDSQDNLYVFNRGTHPMVVYDSEGNVLHTWGHGIFDTPHGVAVGPDDSVYCIDSGDSTVRKFTPEGKLLMTLGTPGEAPPPLSGVPFNRPTTVAFEPGTDALYVADGYSNAHVHKFSGNGELLHSWGASGTEPGHFNIVHDISVDTAGRVYIADRENHRVQIFAADGAYLTQWANLSKAACVLADPRGEDLVYVGEYFGGIDSNAMGMDLGPRVSILDTAGNVLARLGRESYGDEPGRFYSPHSLAVDSKGDIYVAEVSWSEYGRNLDPPRELRSLQKLIHQPA